MHYIYDFPGHPSLDIPLSLKNSPHNNNTGLENNVVNTRGLFIRKIRYGFRSFALDFVSQIVHRLLSQPVEEKCLFIIMKNPVQGVNIFRGVLLRTIKVFLHYFNTIGKVRLVR